MYRLRKEKKRSISSTNTQPTMYLASCRGSNKNGIPALSSHSSITLLQQPSPSANVITAEGILVPSHLFGAHIVVTNHLVFDVSADDGPVSYA